MDTIEEKDEHENEEEFFKPKREPTDEEKRNLLAKTFEILIITSLENHVYKFGNKVRKQGAGGPIGLSLTGEIAELYMIYWDREFLEKLKSVGIIPALYERFKDDLTILVKSLEAGTKWQDGTLVVDPEKAKTDAEKTNEDITMEVIQDIANSMDDMIKFTVDHPKKHKSGKIPILDIQASINKDKQNMIQFEFYEKPTKNQKVIMSDSAIPSSQKRTILTQECLRRLRNTQIALGEEVQLKHVNKFMVNMRNSGYNAKYRQEIVDSTFKAFDEMIKADQEGTKPLYRDKTWKKDIRRTQKQEKRRNWYKNGGSGTKKIDYTTVLFVPVTKGSILAKEMRKREEEINKYSKVRIKIVEDAGIKLKSLLVDKNPFPKTKCEQKKCVICMSVKSENPKFECNSNNVGYRLGCDTCADRGLVRVYEGESSRSARIRGAEHFADLRHDRPTGVLYKHKKIEHPSEEMNIRMEIIKKFRDPLTRQANEAVRIDHRGKMEHHLLNSKSEFNHPPVKRIVVEKQKFKKKSNFQTMAATSKQNNLAA